MASAAFLRKGVPVAIVAAGLTLGVAATSTPVHAAGSAPTQPPASVTQPVAAAPSSDLDIEALVYEAVRETLRSSSRRRSQSPATGNGGSRYRDAYNQYRRLIGDMNSANACLTSYNAYNSEPRYYQCTR
jgi:hypothetical protein